MLIVGGTVVAALLAYGGLLAALWWGQERLIFLPQALDPATSLALAPDVHEAQVPVSGATLSVLELRLPAPRGVVFYLHGNAGNLKTWFTATDFYRQANFDLVMMDYRGYGKSTGRIRSEAELHGDVQAVWAHYAPRYQGQRIVVFGRSLGSGLASTLAARIQPDLTVLVSPYRSLTSLASQHYAWVPTGLLRYRLHTDEVISRIDRPILLLHGERDELIPPSHSHELAAITTRARAVIVPGAGHADVHEHAAYRAALREALDTLP